MEITEEQLEYTLKFDSVYEMKEFMIWCFDNNIFDVVRLHYYPDKFKFNSVKITFADNESTMAFKLRWV